jgi:hypothetical protein
MSSTVRYPRIAPMRSSARASVPTALLLAMLVAAVQPSRAAEVSAVPTAAPSTTAHYFSSHPMIAGTVVTVNDHQMVVDTDQGERVTLEVDTRTMAPRDLAPGMTVRTDFVALEDCRFYAERVMALRNEMAANRLQAYANSRDSRDPNALNASASDGHRWRASARQWNAEPGTTGSAGEPAPGMLMKAIPTIEDHDFSARPMLSGRVVSVNDHRLVVQTDQGRMVAMVMDSRTMVPREISPGAGMRTEFTELKDGRYYAKRVSLTGSAIADREQAYANTRDTDLAVAGNIGDCVSVSPSPANAVTSALEPPAVVPAAVVPAPVVAQSSPAPVAETPKLLPQTASRRPLFLMLGLLAVGAAGLSSLVRGLRTV